MAVVSMKNLLESGVHFGHTTRRWNPKMNEYIYTSRNGIHIIDLQKSVKKIESAYEKLKQIVMDGGNILFVGTKKQAVEVVKEEAERCQEFYVNQRWLGGTLTNFKTINKRIKRLHDLYAKEENGTFDVLPKKEIILLKKEREKLEKFLYGIKDMKKLPKALFIIDPRKERNAIAEAKILNIPVFGIVDTNCDPDLVDYVIPANDDAIRAVKLVVSVMANAVCEGKNLPTVEFKSVPKDDKRKPRPENSRYDDRKKPRPANARFDDRKKYKPENAPKFDDNKDERKTVIKEVKEPVIKEVKEPVAKEVKEPVVKEVKEPVAKKVKEPVIKEVKEPVAKEVKEPVAKEAKEPVAKEAKEPVAKEVKEPVAKKVKEPVAKEVKEPVAKEVKEPVAKEVKEPVAKKVKEPVAKEAKEAIAKEVKEPVVKKTKATKPAVDKEEVSKPKE